MEQWEREAESRLAARRDFRAALARPRARHHRGDQEGVAQQGRAVGGFRPARASPAPTNAAARRRFRVLTDEAFFQGSLADLEAARAAVSLPVLRKDFTIAPAQIAGSRGARRRRHPADRRHPHRARDPRLPRSGRALRHGGPGGSPQPAANSTRPSPPAAEIIGVNNRDLTTFEVTLETSLRLAEHMPAGVLRVSESGIHDARGYRHGCARAGYHAFLVGEHLMKSGDPAAALRKLVAA